MNAVTTIMNGIRTVAKVAVIILFSYLSFAILLQVLGRYLSGWVDFDIDWTEESACFAQIWLILVAAGLAMKDRMHVGVDLLLQYIPATPRRAIVAVTSLACLGFLLVTIYHSFTLIRVGGLQTSSALGIPMSWVYMAMPIGLAYFALEFVLVTIERLTGEEEPQS